MTSVDKESRNTTMGNILYLIPKSWQTFIASIILHILLPLLPLFLEKVFTQSITPKSLTLASSMYTITIGLSSRSEVLLSVGIFTSLLNASFFGFISVSTNSPPESAITLAWVSMFAIGLMHALERINRHVYEREPFLKIRSGSKDTKP